MNAVTNSIEQVLLTDRVWSAYALADLEPEHKEFCTWSIKDQSILLIYNGLNPPVLFMQGRISQVSELLTVIHRGNYQFSCLPEHLPAIQTTLVPEQVTEMWRMVHSEQADAIDPEDVQVQRLDLEHLEDIRGLFVGHRDAPDAFSTSQLRTGTFFGVYDGERLAAISGTHVRSTRYRVAAIGNVFTDPLHRGKGYASLTTQAVLNALLADGMDTIVLNVATSNRAAIKAYQRIGFKPYCGYFEGYGKRI